jgi:hypothetical protein
MHCDEVSCSGQESPFFNGLLTQANPALVPQKIA